MALCETIFEKLKSEKTLFDLYRDGITEDALTGVLTDYNESFCYLSLIDEDGSNNGISVIYKNDISRIRWDGNARESIALLMEEKKTILSTPSLSLTSLKSTIESIQKQFGYVNIHTEYMDDEVCFIGELEEFDDDFLLIHEYGPLSSLDRRHMLLSMKEISRIDAGAQYEKDVTFLGKHRR